MGAARLLAKGWVVFCLFAGAHAIYSALVSGGWSHLPQVGLIIGCVLIFIAMGLLFAGGFGASSGPGAAGWIASLRLADFLPGFDDWVFLGFVSLSYFNQVVFAPEHISGWLANALDRFVEFAVPGQRAFEAEVLSCGLDGGRVLGSSFAWLIAVIYLASACSRLKLQAGIIRLERAAHPETLGPTVLAGILGAIAVVSFQLFYVGMAYPWLPCAAFADVTGEVLAGLAPLMLAYVIVAALAALLASGPEEVNN